MNWRIRNLDGITITSNSDAHSPQKLGREATVIASDMSFDAIMGAIRTNDQRLVGTIEFFPEEGKYHGDGHRLCNVLFTPQQTRAAKGLCPVCAKPLVVGVQYRVDQLASRPAETAEPAKRVEYIVPLVEILAELRGIKTTTGRPILNEYHRLVIQLGSEFDILRKLPIDQIRSVSPPVALAIERMRSGQVHRRPGFDGVYGTIKVFRNHDERLQTLSQLQSL